MVHEQAVRLPTSGADSEPDAALEQLFREHSEPIVSDPLRRAISAYVDARRTAGEPVERIIISLKRVARRGLEIPAVHPPAQSVTLQDEIIEKTVTFCIHHYYREQAR
jgi:hypothetical protein